MPTPSGTNALSPIPSEVTERILIYSRPRGVASFAQTCRDHRKLVYDNEYQYLWRELFLSYPFDDPRSSTPHLEPDCLPAVDWKQELQKRVKAEYVLASGRTDEALDDALETVIGAIAVSPPAEAPVSHNIVWAERLLQSAPFLRSDQLSSTQSTFRSRIRAYLALSHEKEKTDQCKTRLRSLRAEARCFVYDLGNYSKETRWGPFLNKKGNLEINWEHVEKIVHVIVFNMRDMIPDWQKLCPKVGLEMTRAHTAPVNPERDPKDWAGIGGLWRRYISFMDYRELFAFNYSRGARRQSFFDEHHTCEAIRVIDMHLAVIENDMPPSTVDHPDFPRLQFKGTASAGGAASLDAPQAHVEGFVHRLKNGVTRWHFHTHYHGQPQWSAEAVQLGGLCSAAGVVGIWSGVAHQPGDPAGPFTMWKLDDGTKQVHLQAETQS
ncbi:hypothetical protein NLI96_g1618 [Meripilus lineatus]|uniref:F-box domain-containing protein n=1 Tax=Meripilus lineatus TaxID=2056292 RepID=A0AAD5VA12_9APHY|nr:hypothetical protein NLI96_g1618 [Physisporinus lineatus]